MKRLAGLLCLALLASSCAAAQDRLRQFGMDSYARIAAGGKGRPQVVMVWSLDCSYCEPSFAALAQAERRGVTVVTIATDSADDPEAAALIQNKLAHAGLHGPGWAFGPAPAEQLRRSIDPAWRGEMPRSYWFDGKGGVQAYSGLIDPQRVAKMLPR